MSASSELFGGGGTPKKWAAGNYTEGNVVWSPSDYQYYMRKTTGASATDPASDLGNWQPTGDRAIKSIQRGVYDATNSGIATITISGVNTAKSQLSVHSVGTAMISGSPGPCSVTLTNSTTITAYTGVNPTSMRFGWEVIERN